MQQLMLDNRWDVPGGENKVNQEVYDLFWAEEPSELW